MFMRGGKIIDILYEAAVSYNQLKNITYEIVLGRKGKLYKLALHFPPDAFFHLAGLQHLKDITFPSTNKERIFKEILSKKFTFKSISKSIFLKSNFIEERITNLHLLETMLDSNTITYLINRNEYIKYTNIKADYLFEYKDIGASVFYLFIFIQKLKPRFLNECIGCSFFKKHDLDYTNGASKTTVLMISKIANYGSENESREIKYRNPAYKSKVGEILSFHNTNCQNPFAGVK